MEEIIFTFPSFTYANKARRLLQRTKISANLIKLGPSENGSGCTYGLSIRREDHFAVVGLFMENNIDYGVIKSIRHYDLS